jgi:DNA (cytosine-5)-methyltransferase 1
MPKDRVLIHRTLRALDLFGGEGGVSKGLHDAGFRPVGVDIDARALTRYPYDWQKMDALQALRTLLDGGMVCGYELDDFDLIWASCPCQAHSDLQKQNKRDYPDFIPMTRALLERTGKPYIIENVEGAPLRNPVRICGAGIPGLRVIRHRIFESNIPLRGVDCPDRHPLVFTHDKRKAHYGQLDQDTSFVQVTGGGNATLANKRDAMGMPWASNHGLNEAIPPAYTEHIGRQLAAHIGAAVAA